MSIRVVKPGVLTTVQDGGRTGFQAKGFNVSGVMDRRAYRFGNFLVGNYTDEAVLEMSMFGGSFTFLESNYIAITGADMGATIEGVPAPMYETVFVREGDTLSFGAAKDGMYTYIAFAGGLDIPQVLGSRSTNLKCALGGFNGRKLKAGDILPFRKPLDDLGDLRVHHLPQACFDGEAPIRVVLGPQDDYFTEPGIRTFLSAPYRVTEQTDRMGCKLDGETIEYKDKVDIISDGIVFGSVQVPPRGTPIVMLADRQTTGGYAKIATVITVDLPRLVQKKPGDTVYFEAISAKEAEKLLKQEQQQFETLLLHYGEDLIG